MKLSVVGVLMVADAVRCYDIDNLTTVHGKQQTSYVVLNPEVRRLPAWSQLIVLTELDELLIRSVTVTVRSLAAVHIRTPAVLARFINPILLKFAP